MNVLSAHFLYFTLLPPILSLLAPAAKKVRRRGNEGEIVRVVECVSPPPLIKRFFFHLMDGGSLGVNGRGQGEERGFQTLFMSMGRMTALFFTPPPRTLFFRRRHRENGMFDAFD